MMMLTVMMIPSHFPQTHTRSHLSPPACANGQLGSLRGLDRESEWQLSSWKGRDILESDPAVSWCKEPSLVTLVTK